jgi:hypothetical protein
MRMILRVGECAARGNDKRALESTLLSVRRDRAHF